MVAEHGFGQIGEIFDAVPPSRTDRRSEEIAMKRKTKASKTRTNTTRGKKTAKPVRVGTQLEKVLALIRARPGIRPSEINRRLKLAQSDAPRAALIKRGLIRKEKNGSAVRYYAI
jgi:hypothetical protein